MEPEPPFLPGAGADPIWSEPESAPGPRTSGAGAAQKSGGSATLCESGIIYSVSGYDFYEIQIRIRLLIFKAC